MSIRERQTVRVNPPPFNKDGSLVKWMREVTDALNTLPPLSTFSYPTPESNVSAIPGTIGVNLATDGSPKLWIKESGDSTTGWTSIAT